MSAVAERIKPISSRKEVLREQTPPAKDVLTLTRPDRAGAPLRLTTFKVDSLAPRDPGTSPFSEKGNTCPSCPEDSLRVPNLTVVKFDTKLHVTSTGQSREGANGSALKSVEDECTWAGDACRIGKLNTADQQALVAKADARGDHVKWSADLNLTSFQGGDCGSGGNRGAEIHQSGNWRCDSVNFCIASEAREKVSVKAGALDVVSFKTNEAKTAQHKASEEQYSGPCSDC